MKGRRPLAAGIRTESEMKELEQAFVFGASKVLPAQEESPPENSTEAPTSAVGSMAQEETGTSVPVRSDSMPTVLPDRQRPQVTARVPITTRARPEIASALRRAALQRQLAGVEPCYVQDIMEEAVEVWLSAKGYL